MAQVWKCKNCEGTTQNPKLAGDHEREFYGKLIKGSRDPEFWKEGDPLLHFMDDIGE